MPAMSFIGPHHLTSLHQVGAGNNAHALEFDLAMLGAAAVGLILFTVGFPPRWWR